MTLTFIREYQLKKFIVRKCNKSKAALPNYSELPSPLNVSVNSGKRKYIGIDSKSPFSSEEKMYWKFSQTS